MLLPGPRKVYTLIVPITTHSSTLTLIPSSMYDNLWNIGQSQHYIQTNNRVTLFHITHYKNTVFALQLIQSLLFIYSFNVLCLGRIGFPAFRSCRDCKVTNPRLTAVHILLLGEQGLQRLRRQTHFIFTRQGFKPRTFRL